MITNRTRVTFENGTTIEVDKGTSQLSYGVVVGLSVRVLLGEPFPIMYNRQ